MKKKTHYVQTLKGRNEERKVRKIGSVGRGEDGGRDGDRKGFIRWMNLGMVESGE